MPNISNSNNSVICQARSLKFCMVVDLDNTNKLYHDIPCHAIPYNTIPQYTNSYHKPNISNSHNSVISQTRCLKFSVVVDSNRPYHAILYHTIKYQIPNISNSHNSVIFQARSQKICIVVDLDNTNRPYHTGMHFNLVYMI